MSLRTSLAKWIGGRELRGSLENPATPITDTAAMLQLLGMQPSTAGVMVSPESAMRFGAVYTCIKVLGETVGSLPFQVFERTEKGKKLAAKRPEYKLLHDAPNAAMTSIVWREILVAQQQGWGNHYSWIRWANSGRIYDIQPLLPNSTTPKKAKDGTMSYEVQTASGRQILSADEVLHIPALGWDGVKGISPIGMLRNAIGAGLAAEEFAARFFANDARPGIVIETPFAPNTKKAGEIKDDVDEKFGGLGNKWKSMTTGPGVKIHTITMPMDDAQFLETRKFQKSEIFGIYRVPPHLGGDLDKATFSNIEQQDIGFAKHTIRPLNVRIEQEINRKLFPKGDYFVEINIDGLLRGDFKSRMEGYAQAVGGPFLLVDEVRGLENFEPVPGGDRRLIPVNMAPVDQAGQVQPISQGASDVAA